MLQPERIALAEAMLDLATAKGVIAAVILIEDTGEAAVAGRGKLDTDWMLRSALKVVETQRPNYSGTIATKQ